MRSTRRPVLTPRIEDLVRRGLTNGQIYEALEGHFPRPSIATVISITRKKFGRPQIMTGRAPSAWLTASQRAQLAVVAEEYGWSASTLVSKIIAAVVDDDMFEAVIGPVKHGRDKAVYKTGAAAPRN